MNIVEALNALLSSSLALGEVITTDEGIKIEVLSTGPLQFDLAVGDNQSTWCERSPEILESPQ